MDVETQKTARNKLSSHSDKQAVHGLQFRYQKSKGMAMSAGCSLLSTAEMVKKLIDQKFKVLSKVFTNCSEELSSSLLFDKHSQAKKEKQNNLEQWLRNWITVVQSADVGINRMLKECGIDPGSVTVPTYHSVGTEVDFARLPEPQKCEEIQKPPENQSGKEVQESQQNENAFLNTVQPEDNTAGSQDRISKISRSDRERDSKSSRYLGNSLRVKSYRSIRLPDSRDGTTIPGSVPEDRSVTAPSEAFDGRKEDPLEQKSRPSSDMGKWDKHPKAHSQDLSEKPEVAIPSLFKRKKIGPNSLNSKLDIYVGTSKGKTTVTAIAGLKNVIYVEKGKTEKEARPFHYCLISVIKKHSDESIANIDLLKAPDIIPNRKLESTVGLIPDQPSDILLLFLGDDRATAIKQNPQILIAEKYTNILHMHHLSVLAVEPKTDMFDRDFFFQTGKFAPKYHKSPRHSILLLEAKQQRVYKNKAPYTLLKDEDRRISHKDGETFEVTDKVSLMQLNLVQKRFRTILNSSRTYDHNLSYSTIRDSGDIFEFAFIQDTARYIYFWSPSVSTWVNDLLESAEKIKHQLLERADDESVQTATNQCIFDLRFDANALELDPKAPHFDEFPTFMAVLSQNTLQQTSWRIGCVGFVTRDNGQRQKVELGYFGFNVSSSLEESEVFYGYRVLPFVKENLLVVVGFVHHLDRRSKPVALCGYQVTLDPSLQQLLGQSRIEDLESDQYHLLRDHGQVSPTQLFRIDLKDSVPHPPVLVHPKGTPPEVAPYPEREAMIKLDTRYDKHKKEYNIAVIATTHRMLTVLSVPCHSLPLISAPPVNLAKSEGHKPAPKQTDLLLSPRTLKTYHFEYQEYKDAPDAMKLGPSGVSWQQEEQKNLILLSSGCNYQITVDFDLLRSQKLAQS